MDKESEWGYSSTKGWVQGYGLDVLCTATNTRCVVPLDASSDTANVHEIKTARRFFKRLPKRTKYIIADGKYDCEELISLCEERRNGKYITRRLIAHMDKVASNNKRRISYWRFNNSKVAKRLYARRGVTIEPLLGTIANLFDIDPVWQRGKMNNCNLLPIAVFAYQLLMYYNWRNGCDIGCVKYILDGL